MKLKVTDKYYESITENVVNDNGTACVRDVPVITQRTILANRPDIALNDKKEREDLLIDQHSHTR